MNGRAPTREPCHGGALSMARGRIELPTRGFSVHEDGSTIGHHQTPRVAVKALRSPSPAAVVSLDRDGDPWSGAQPGPSLLSAA